MPPGDLPVTIAQVAKVTRSAASRGGMSELSALATVSWLSAAAAPVRLGAPLPVGPAGLVGGGGIDTSEAGGGGAAGASGSAWTTSTWTLAISVAISEAV